MQHVIISNIKKILIECETIPTWTEMKHQLYQRRQQMQEAYTQLCQTPSLHVNYAIIEMNHFHYNLLKLSEGDELATKEILYEQNLDYEEKMKEHKIDTSYTQIIAQEEEAEMHKPSL